MLTANVPFKGDSDYQVMTDHVNAMPPLPTKFYPYIPLGLQNAVLKALEKQPDARFQTVEEFGAALEQPDTFGVVPDVVPGVVPAAIPVEAVPASRRATVVESDMKKTAPATRSVAPVVVSGAAAAAAAPVTAAAPAKTTFWTPERKIAGGGVATILVLIGAWLALRPNVKNTGLPSAPGSLTSTQPTPQ